jgi:hypothetical protein
MQMPEDVTDPESPVFQAILQVVFEVMVMVAEPE